VGGSIREVEGVEVVQLLRWDRSAGLAESHEEKKEKKANEHDRREWNGSKEG
jgi:hypothetical protein